MVYRADPALQRGLFPGCGVWELGDREQAARDTRRGAGGREAEQMDPVRKPGLLVSARVGPHGLRSWAARGEWAGGGSPEAIEQRAPSAVEMVF